MDHRRLAERIAAKQLIARLLVVAAGSLASGACEIRDGANEPRATSPAGSPGAAVSPVPLPDPPVSSACAPSGARHPSEAIVPGRERPAGAATRGIEFIKGYQPGYDLARRLRRPILLFFTAEWCQYCHQLADEAFCDEEVVDLSRRFVCVVVDADAEPEICRRFQVRGYPTVLFVSPLAAPLSRIVGKQPPADFVARMRAALQSVARGPDRVQRR